MDVLMDGLLMAATLFAGCYCWVLARRVRDLKSLDKGLGGSIVNLTRQVELARGTLEEARAAGTGSQQELGQMIDRADAAAGQLRLLLAAAEDPRTPQPARPAARPPEARAPARPGERRQIVLSETDAQANEPAGEAEEPDAPGLPKPRALPPLDNPLRRRLRDDAPPPRDESEILAALSVMASGGR